MTGVGANYAQALYTLAKEENADGQILGQLRSLDEAFSAEPDFLRLLAAPGLSKDQRVQIIDESFRDKVHPYLLNFMKLLTEKGYARQFGECVKAYQRLYNEDNGIVSVRAVTAVALTPEQHSKLLEKLQKVTGKKVELQSVVDPACMGGIRLDYDGKQVDGTVKNHLETIGALLKNTVL